MSAEARVSFSRGSSGGQGIAASVWDISREAGAGVPLSRHTEEDRAVRLIPIALTSLLVAHTPHPVLSGGWRIVTILSGHSDNPSRLNQIARCIRSGILPRKLA